MANVNDISINIGISISDETVQRCCQLLSIYLTDNPNRTIDTSSWQDYQYNKTQVSVFITEKDRHISGKEKE